MRGTTALTVKLGIARPHLSVISTLDDSAWKEFGISIFQVICKEERKPRIRFHRISFKDARPKNNNRAH
jgi:hypothetical protein